MSDSQSPSSQPDPQPARPTSPTRRKRKHRPSMPQKEGRRRMKTCARDASRLVQEALPIAISISESAGIPGLTPALEALLTILGKIETMRTNIEGVESLKTRIKELTDKLKEVLDQFEDIPEDIKRRVDILSTKLGGAGKKAEGIRTRGFIKRFFTSNSDTKKLQSLVDDTNTAIQDFVTQTVSDIDRNVHVVLQTLKAIETELDMSLLSTYAKHAHWKSSSVRRECLEGTRTNVLADAYSWIHERSKEVAESTAEDRSAHFLWINGWAGTGKTTIACSMAKKFEKEGTLGANFFCSHLDAECRNPQSIFITIARQLCRYHQPFKEKVIRILKTDPDIVYTNPLEQFKALILQPLRELEGLFPTCVVIIDALDECQHEHQTSEILDILARHTRELAPFIFVITSRPEPHITALFERAAEMSLKDSTEPLILHNVHLGSVLGDIRRYLIHGFREIRRVYIIEDEWPSTQELDRLTELSRGLFIFATTVLRFIGDANPKEHLQALLTAKVPIGIMHNLYLEVLTLAYKNVDTLHTTNPSLRRLLGAITFAEEPLSAPALARLFDIAEGDVRNTLAKLRSVLHIPEEGSEDVIRFIHPTFPEFLCNELVTKPEAFRIISAEHNLTLFTRSVMAMDNLKRNIARIERPTLFRSEIPGLSDVVKDCIPAHIVYASRFWSVHLSRCAGNALEQAHYNLFSAFLRTRVLYWLEACSLLRVLDGALAALDIAKGTCRNLKGLFSGLVTLLEDYHLFLWTYYYCIDVAPLQVYHSALVLSPAESHTKKTCDRELGDSMIIRSGALVHWPPRRDAFVGHEGKAVWGVAFSSSGDYLITGGGDHKLKKWEVSTRTMVLSFDGHTDEVTSVAFSPDGMHIASASDDHDVSVWSASSGKRLYSLKGHQEPVNSMMYSANGCHILSMTDQGELKLWNTSDRNCIRTIGEPTGNTNWGWQAALSPDGGAIACGRDYSLFLYDVASGSSATDGIFDFHGPPTRSPVEACLFSPDGRYIAARSWYLIHIWNHADMTLIRSIEVRETLRSCRLAFSPDGTHIGCGSEYGSVYLWKVVSDDPDDPPLVIRAHTASVSTIAWSPDGSRLASASTDGTVRVCDITAFTTQLSARAELPAVTQLHPTHTGHPRFALVHHEDRTVLLHLPRSVGADIADIVALASMPEGAPSMSFFADMLSVCDAAIRVIDNPSRIAHTRARALITGYQRTDFYATMHWNQPLCIAPNGILLAYRQSTSIRMVDVFNIRTGTVVTLTVDSGVTSIAFSPDSTLIATGSKDGYLRLWDAATGSLRHRYEVKHTSWVQPVVFSPDGCLIASSSTRDELVHLFGVVEKEHRVLFDSHRGSVQELFFAPENHIITLDNSDHIYVWDLTTGACLVEVPLYDDSWIHALDFSLDGAPTLTAGDLKVSTSSPWMHSNPTWPMYAVSKEGWVYAKSPGHTVRMCWLPPELRAIPAWNGPKFYCFDSERKTIVTFDVSHDPVYVRLWGTGT